MNGIKGVLMDFGGTVDTNGIHWMNMFSRAYSAVGVEVNPDTLRKAYIYAERTLGSNRIVLPQFTFRMTLKEKIRLQAEALEQDGVAAVWRFCESILDWCYDRVSKNIMDVSVPVLESVSRRMPIVLVTNFYGNMHTVLGEFGLEPYFKDVVESARVGARKPDVTIYHLGLAALGLKSQHVVMVGDSADKDVVPAAEVGCRTIWLKNNCWDCSEAQSDCVIEDFGQLSCII